MMKKIICIGIVSMFLLMSFTTFSLAEPQISKSNISTESTGSSLIIVYLKCNENRITENSLFWGNYLVWAKSGIEKIETFARIGNDPRTFGDSPIQYSNCFWWYLDKDKEYEVGVNFKPNLYTRYVKTTTDITPDDDVEKITLEWEGSLSESKTINPLFNNVLSRLLDNHPNMFPLLRAILGL